MNYLPIKLLKLRKHYNYSQSYLANVLGVDDLTYMAIENGRQIINYAQAKKLASLYHISIMEILENKEDVTLYDVSDANTDEINIEYFLPKKTFTQKLKDLLIGKPILSIAIGGLLTLIIVFVVLILVNRSEPYEPIINDLSRLSVNETSLVYIDKNGGVKGSGDNSNSQLSNLPSKSAIKVQEGLNFSLILLDDGTIYAEGLSSKYKDEISKWENIIDIAAGDKHVLAIDSSGSVYGLGDNTYGQLDVDSWRNIVKIFATPFGSIGINDKGECYYTGSFLGTSLLKNKTDISCINGSHENLMVLKNNGTVEYIASSDKPIFYKVMEFRDIVDVACGNDFFAALKNDGTVLIAIENDRIEEIVSEWKNIVAIDAYDNYLVAYDGENIFGVGKNDYHQFDDGSTSIQTLPQVKNIEVKCEKETIRVKFEPVNNCDFYQVTLNVGTGISKKVKANEIVEFDSIGLEKNNIYSVAIVSLGDDEIYEDSKPSEYTFTYDYEENEIVTRSDLLGLSRAEFEGYLNEIGISDIEGFMDEGACMNDEEIVINIEGIEANTRYKKDELKDMKVVYKYCSILGSKGN